MILQQKAAVVGAVVLLSLSGCKKDTTGLLSNSLPDGVAPQSSGVFNIYKDELLTGGGAALVPGGENQSLSLEEFGAASEGRFNVGYTWNGGDVLNAGTLQHLFAGFMFPVTAGSAGLPTARGRDLSAPGYTKLVLSVKGALSNGTTLRIEGPSDGDTSVSPARVESGATTFSLTGQWQEITLAVPAASFINVKIFLTITLQYAQPPRTTVPGEGGVVYLDNIRYER